MSPRNGIMVIDDITRVPVLLVPSVDEDEVVRLEPPHPMEVSTDRVLEAPATDQDSPTPSAPCADATAAPATSQQPAQQAAAQRRSARGASTKAADDLGRRLMAMMWKDPKRADTALTWVPNPKQLGTKSHRRYQVYSKATTIREFKDLGGKLNDLKWDYVHGHVSLPTDVHLALLDPTMAAVVVDCFAHKGTRYRQNGKPPDDGGGTRRPRVQAGHAEHVLHAAARVRNPSDTDNNGWLAPDTPLGRGWPFPICYEGRRRACGRLTSS